MLGLAPLLAARGRRPRVAASSPSRRVRRAARRARRRQRGRADDFTVVRGGSASLLFRTFVADRIVRGRQREASGELAGQCRESCSRTSRTGRAASTSRPSSRPGAPGCRTTSSCSPTGPGAGMTTTVISALSPGRRSARTRQHMRAASASDLWRLLLWPIYGPVRGRPARHRVRRPSPASAPRPTTSRSRPRASRRTSRRRTGGSARCGRRRPSIRSSSATRADAARSAAIDREVERLLAGPPRPRGQPRARGGGQRPLASLSAAVHVAPGRFAAALWRRPRGIAISGARCFGAP